MIKIINNKVIVKKKCKKKFEPNIFINNENKRQCFEFAYLMAFKEKHNPHSFGSKKDEHIRKKIEIFRDAFQGKLAEVGFYNFYKDRKEFLEPLPEPNFEIWNRGKWEDTDFEIKTKNKTYRISIKSTKHYGNLLMLEKERYDSKGNYLEGVKKKKVKHDLIFLVRVMGTDSFIYQNEKILNDNSLFDKIKIEITGYITNSQFIEIIKKNQFLPAGVILGGQPLKVDNYYICAKKLRRPKK